LEERFAKVPEAQENAYSVAASHKEQKQVDNSMPNANPP
jgi:hypothetical protein